MKIYIDGKDNMGWAIDENRKNLICSLQRLSIKQSSNIFTADIVHNIWWNNILADKKFLKYFYASYLKRKEKLVVTAFNFIDLEANNYFLKERYEKIKNIAYAWIAPSIKQKKILEKYGCKVYYQPHYHNIDLFKPYTNNDNRVLLAKNFNIPYKKISNKVIIGSFQRDSLGSDLSKPKWQKGPDILVQILKEMPKDKYVLLLSGPRRHWIINQCKKNNIPYVYTGREIDVDDIDKNYLNIEDMPKLYYLIDIYLVTSKSEGGPHAILEATTTKTFIYSTDVGLASDFLDKSCIFNDIEKYKKALYSFITNFDKNKVHRTNIIEKQYKNAIDILNYKAMDQRLYNIYQDIIKERKVSKR